MREPVVRSREDVLKSLEELYGEAYRAAQESGDDAGQRKLDFDYRRDQLILGVFLDIRDGLRELGDRGPGKEGDATWLDRAKTLRRIADLKGAAGLKLP